MPKPFVHPQVAGMSVQEFAALVGQILDGIPNDLADEWLEEIADEQADEPDQPLSRQAFWDAASLAPKHLLMRGALVLPGPKLQAALQALDGTAIALIDAAADSDAES
jgi:hypothetical protein